MPHTSTYKSNNKVVVLVTSDALNARFFEGGTHIEYYHVNAAGKIFPSLFTYQPGTIVIDHDFLEGNVQELVRRIRGNSFYDKLKICCLKTAANRKMDEQLKVIGVDYLVYKTSSLAVI